MKKFFFKLVVLILFLSLANTIPRNYYHEIQTIIYKPKNIVWMETRPPENAKSYVAYQGQQNPNETEVNSVTLEERKNPLGNYISSYENVEDGESYEASVAILDQLVAKNRMKLGLSADGNNTKVNVVLSGNNAFPLNVLMNAYMVFIKRDIEKNMNNLKSKLETVN